MPAQRLRVRFTKGERVRYISHLDVLRHWERAIRRAGLPLSYSQGFTPHPKLAFAAPLALGFTSEAEIMEVTLDERIDAAEFATRLAAESSPDLEVRDVAEVALAGPAPQAVLLWADYRVEAPGVAPALAAGRCADFLACAEVPWTVEKAEKTKTVDLRAGVATLRACANDGGTTLLMRLRADQEHTTRPEHVLGAILPGVEAAAIVRTGLVFDEASPARAAWRRKGQYEG